RGIESRSRINRVRVSQDLRNRSTSSSRARSSGRFFPGRDLPWSHLACFVRVVCISFASAGGWSRSRRTSHAHWPHAVCVSRVVRVKHAGHVILDPFHPLGWCSLLLKACKCVPPVGGAHTRVRARGTRLDTGWTRWTRFS